MSGFDVGPEGGTFLTGPQCLALWPILRAGLERHEALNGGANATARELVGRVYRQAHAYRAMLRDLQARRSETGHADTADTPETQDSILNDHDEPHDVVTVAEAAKILRTNERQVRRLIDRGALDAQHDGRGTPWLIRADSVARLSTDGGKTREEAHDGRLHAA